MSRNIIIFFILATLFSTISLMANELDYQMEKKYLKQKSQKRKIASLEDESLAYQEAPIENSIYEEKLESTYSNEFIRSKFRRPVHFSDQSHFTDKDE